jgi:FAD/FMN-containing dehydrogenase
MTAAVRRDVERVLDLFRPYDAGRTYFNFTETPVESSALFPAETVRRLREIKRTVDPDNLFFACHPVAPA